ncbi:MAG: hypothetical protein AAGA56_28295 [Myxococcota bacterium]
MTTQSTISKDAYEAQSAMRLAARHGLHDGMIVFTDDSPGDRLYGIVKVTNQVIVKRSDGRVEPITEQWRGIDRIVADRWRPASYESLHPAEYDRALSMFA